MADWEKGTSQFVSPRPSTLMLRENKILCFFLQSERGFELDGRTIIDFSPRSQT